MQATPLIFDLFAPSYYVDDEKESNYMHFKLITIKNSRLSTI